MRPIWQKTTEKDALVGVGITGIGGNKLQGLDLKAAARIVKNTNATYAKIIGINEAARSTLIKPSGTTSLVLGSSSGVHAWHGKWFLRTIRFNMNEDIALYMLVNHPELCEVDKLRSDVLCVRIPMKAPENAILRSESAIDLLERVKHFSQEWIKPGHGNGINTHNVSATISIDKSREYGRGFSEAKDRYFFTREEQEASKDGSVWEKLAHIDEWEAVGEWMWNNKDIYNGLSVLPYDGGTYVQAPFEECTEEEYNKRIASLTDVDLTKVIEIDDNTAFTQDSACSGGKCEINV